MINQILKDIDNEECYYVGSNGCLYQDLEKNELLAIKEEIERLNNIINEAIEYIEEDIKGNYFKRYDDEVYKMCEDLLDILKGVDKE